MNPSIQLTNITKVYGKGAEATAALKNITFAINPGESVAIVGKSGSGKSTLMHIMATLDKPTSGELQIGDSKTNNLGSRDLDSLRNQRFGFVFQQFFLNGRNTVLENVVLPLTIMGVSASDRRKRGAETLAAVGLADKSGQIASELSGGQKQRLVMARALITNPDVIFADEPTGNLDTENGKIVTDLLFRLQKEKGITLVIVTHDPDLAKLCNRIITIRDGEIV